MNFENFKQKQRDIKRSDIDKDLSKLNSSCQEKSRVKSVRCKPIFAFVMMLVVVISISVAIPMSLQNGEVYEKMIFSVIEENKFNIKGIDDFESYQKEKNLNMFDFKRKDELQQTQTITYLENGEEVGINARYSALKDGSGYEGPIVEYAIKYFYNYFYFAHNNISIMSDRDEYKGVGVVYRMYKLDINPLLTFYNYNIQFQHENAIYQLDVVSLEVLEVDEILSEIFL